MAQLHLARKRALGTLTTALFVSGALVLSGCSSDGGAQAPADNDVSAPTQNQEPDAPAPDNSDADNSDNEQPAVSGAKGSATYTFPGGSYEVELAQCLVSEDDILMHGPGKEEGGSGVGYLDVDVSGITGDMYGEVRLDFGITTQFGSGDEFLVMRIGSADGGEVTTSGKSGRIDGMVFREGYVEQGEGTFTFNC